MVLCLAFAQPKCEVSPAGTAHASDSLSQISTEVDRAEPPQRPTTRLPRSPPGARPGNTV